MRDPCQLLVTVRGCGCLEATETVHADAKVSRIRLCQAFYIWGSETCAAVQSTRGSYWVDLQ